MTKTNPIIVAIDTPDKARAKALCAMLNGHVGAVKLGLEFFSAHGPAGVREVLPEGLPLFLDLKFHDIPNTVSKAIRALKGLPIHLLTIHTSGGASMMKAAAEAADWLGGQGSTRPKVLGVTVLTSLDALDMEQIGVGRDVGQQVEKLVLLAKASGLDGIVCSPHEIKRLQYLKAEVSPPLPPVNGEDEFIFVVPGIRPEGSAQGDQKRVMTPKEALAAGADYLVIGRPITEAENPLDVIKAL